MTNIIWSYVKNSIKDIVLYNISPNSSAAQCKVDEHTEARIIQMTCASAPKGRSRWTLRLLEEKTRVELDALVEKEATHQTLKNELRPLKSWYIPQKENAGFVACMEDILDIYEKPYYLLGKVKGSAAYTSGRHPKD